MTIFAPLKVAVLGVGLFGFASLSIAQETERAPTQEQLFDPAAQAPGGISGVDRFLDLRQELRNAILRAARYARETKPGFPISVLNGSGLLAKPKENDEIVKVPARAFQSGIDALFQDGLFYGRPTFNKPRPKENHELLMRDLNFAKDARIPIFSIEYAKDAKAVGDALRKGFEEGVIIGISNQPRGLQNMLPRLQSQPPRENGNSVLSLKDVRNFILIRDSGGFGSEAEYAFRMKDTNYDLVVTGVFHDRRPLSKRAVETLKYKKLGARRLVFALMDIGSAAAYRYYWQDDWREGSPEFIAAPFPNDPDRYFVNYWDPEWQRIMFGNTDSYLYGVIAQGFDGVVIEGGDGYRFFEDPDSVLRDEQ